MDSVLRGHAYAKSPVDVACWDILGKAAGQPVAAGAQVGGLFGTSGAIQFWDGETLKPE